MQECGEIGETCLFGCKSNQLHVSGSLISTSPMTFILLVDLIIYLHISETVSSLAYGSLM